MVARRKDAGVLAAGTPKKRGRPPVDPAANVLLDDGTPASEVLRGTQWSSQNVVMTEPAATGEARAWAEKLKLTQAEVLRTIFMAGLRAQGDAWAVEHGLPSRAVQAACRDEAIRMAARRMRDRRTKVASQRAGTSAGDAA